MKKTPTKQQAYALTIELFTKKISRQNRGHYTQQIFT